MLLVCEPDEEAAEMIEADLSCLLLVFDLEGELGTEATGSRANVSAFKAVILEETSAPGKMKLLAASISPLLALATFKAVTVVFPASFSFSASSLPVNEPIEEERLSELACEKIEHEVADPRLVVDDRDDGRAKGSDADADEEEEDEQDEVIESLV